jgi:hypothetical protein
MRFKDVIPIHIIQHYWAEMNTNICDSDECVLTLAKDAALGLIRYGMSVHRGVEAAIYSMGIGFAGASGAGSRSHRRRVASGCLGAVAHMYRMGSWLVEAMNERLQTAPKLCSLDRAAVEEMIRDVAGELAPLALLLWQAIRSSIAQEVYST